LLTEHLKVSSSLSTEQVWTTDLFVKEIAQLTSFERRKIRHRHAKTNGTKLLRGVSQEIKFQQICSQKLNKVNNIFLHNTYTKQERMEAGTGRPDRKLTFELWNFM